MNDDSRRHDLNILEAISRAATDGVIVSDADGTILEFNVVAEKIFGRSRAEVVGQKMVDILVPPPLRDAHLAGIARQRARPVPMSGSMRFGTLGLHADGSAIPLDIALCTPDTGRGSDLAVSFIRARSPSPVADQATVPHLDARIQGVPGSPEQVAELLVSAPLIVFALDHEGNIEVSLGGGLARIGVQQSELVGRSIYALRPNRPDLRRIFARAVAGEKFRAFVELDGSVWDTQFQPMLGPDREVIGSLGVSVDVTAQIVSEQALRLLAETDTVTGLASRRHTDACLARILAANDPLALMLIDLDDFKDINDSHGHAIGDLVLARIGKRLRRAVPAGAIVGRLGGDELVVGLSSGNVEYASRIADAILKAVSKPMRIRGSDARDALDLDICVTASIGIAVAPEDGVTTSVLMTRADSAMYAAKRSGRASHRFYRADADRASRRLKVSTRLRGAINARAIEVEYQPVIDLRDSSIVGFEALARWNDAELGSVSPGEFIAFAENSPLIDDLFELVLSQAIDMAVACNAGIRRTSSSSTPRSHGGDLLTVSINVAARQLRDPVLPTRIISAAESAGLPPSCIVLELTETALMEDSERTTTLLSVLRDAGVGSSSTTTASATRTWHVSAICRPPASSTASRSTRPSSPTCPPTARKRC
ncbi:diguanylate cyclase [Antrihabitans sp. YC2-6]|nr:diguanylate cyclase [Antrihabitans sp. YC2-6]